MRHLIGMWDAAEPEWREQPPLTCQLPEHPCNFLPGRSWTLLAIQDPSVDRLMHLGGGRFGPIYCLPLCQGCRACHPARIDVQQFKLSRSMRRTRNRNADLEQRVAPLSLTRDKFLLFEKFVTTQFGTKTDHLLTPEERRHFYYSWHLNHQDLTREVSYWEGDRLMAVSTIDIGEQAIYSHYCYYDLTVPKRRLGVFTFLKEIEMCQDRGWPYLYIGFMNRKSPKLKYKEQFNAMELLLPGQGWMPYEEALRSASQTAQASRD